MRSVPVCMQLPMSAKQAPCEAPILTQVFAIEVQLLEHAASAVDEIKIPTDAAVQSDNNFFIRLSLIF